MHDILASARAVWILRLRGLLDVSVQTEPSFLNAPLKLLHFSSARHCVHGGAAAEGL